MKRFINLVLIFIILVVIGSCSFNNISNTLTVTIPNQIGSEVSKGVIPNGDEKIDYFKDCTFAITLTDSRGQVQTLPAVPGDNVSFANIPTGRAEVDVVVKNQAGACCFTGHTEVEIKDGENEAAVEIVDALIRLLNEKGGMIAEIPVREVTEDSVMELNVELGLNDYLTVLGWTNPKTKTRWDFKKDDFADFLKSISGDTELQIDVAVYFGNIYDYINSFDINAMDKTIKVFSEDTDDTKLDSQFHIPDGLDGITLDFSGCQYLTAIGSNVFTDSSNKWVSNLKLPKSITTIDGISAVKDDVFIPAVQNQLKFGENTSAEDSSYGITYGSTVGEWSYYISQNAGNSGLKIDNLKYFFVKESLGEEEEYVNIMKDTFTYKAPYINNTNTSTVYAYSYKGMKCETLELGALVYTIERGAFLDCTATSIILSSGLRLIEAGGLSSDAARKVTYNGTLKDWMKVKCEGEYGATETGPFGRGNNEFYVKDSSDNYVQVKGDIEVPLAKNNGETTFSIDYQLQGLVGITGITIPDPNDYSEKSINEYAFSSMKDLEVLRVNPKVKIGKEIVADTKVTDIYLYYVATNLPQPGYQDSNPNDICSYTGPKSSCLGSDDTIKIKVHVPSSMLNRYNATASTWKYLDDVEIVGDL